MTTDALHVQAASLSLGGRRVLDSIDLCVAQGERLAVVGPNGAGKSSLLHLLAARRAPDAGRVHLLGHDLAQLPPPARARQLAVLHQEEQLHAQLTLHDYVALARIPHGPGTMQPVHAAIERFGLAALATRRMGQMSGGQRRLAALARAVAQSPRVLLLDEPTNHLDLRTRADVLDSVAALGITVVVVLHELSLAARFADRVLVLHQGRAVAHAPPAQALSPALVREVFRMDVHAVRLPGEPPRSALVFEAPVGEAAFNNTSLPA
ncbi:MAG: ABC transporter ATP-binding protein [Pseudomonadota bacterium]|nr:ABC transporter ATP-binding protein [Pseudomonadota bacterium]